MGQQLQQEDDFVAKCMFHLSSAAERLISKGHDESAGTPEDKEKAPDKLTFYEQMTEEAALQYAYHIRRWALAEAGSWEVTTSPPNAGSVRLTLQPAGAGPRASIVMHQSDLEPVTHTKAQLLSRRVWDILQAVPLNPTLLEAFQNPIESKLPELLDPTSPQKLMYSLHIVDKLSSSNGGLLPPLASPVVKEGSGTTEKSEEEKVCVENWADVFVKKGGLRILYDIMMSGGAARVPDVRLVGSRRRRRGRARLIVHHHSEEGKEPYGPACRDYFWLVFGFLFDVPTPERRNLPKCKSQKSRSAAYDLLIELSTYPWDYWPAEESRSECGYVGLTNLGATCYMASCMQHLYMMPPARAAESERKAYNPRSFCKVYQMDHQPLNTGEQKDMAEFFIDLVSKLEEMTPELKKLDCSHVSRTLEEFYTVRCQVADMRNLHQSLDEVTVKDTLEGDNCYTCSQCSAKVRAEKRLLPRILCFNTMRYTFNMLTMLKEKVNTHFSFPMRLDMSGYVEKHLMPAQYQEKVNTHFSFPMRLDMSGYVEKHLMPAQYQEEKRKSAEKKDGDSSPTAEIEDVSEFEEHYEYELIGVTVHTGTADGGHYYSFIRDREHDHHDRWLLFNDAEVKPFDPAHIAAECFGGEMTSKTYDSVTDKFMDFSFEKTNSAYMLFYELSPPRPQRGSDCGQQEEPQPTMVSWVELVTKQFNASAAASESSHCALYLQGIEEGEDNSKLGEASCVTRFIRMLLSLMENGARSHLRHLTEYFSLLYEFSKMGEEEGKFMLRINAISSMVHFYLGQNNTVSAGDKLRPGALDKMVALVAGLVERSRDAAGLLALHEPDAKALLHAKQTRSLVFALCRWNEPLAEDIVTMIFQGIAKHTELLTLLVDGSGAGAGATGGLPCFTQLVIAHLWDVADLLAAGAARVRAAAALLLVALVPSQHFRAGYSRQRPHHPAKLPDTAHHTLHQVYTMLLGKLKAARKYTDIAVHGTMKLTAYFGVMTYCLYHPALSEPSVAVHPNKQALLTFWHAVTVDCPENVHADHEDGEVVAYNRAMLPPYYAILRLCCRRSGAFAKTLAQHQNIHWAFRNIAPHAHLYPAAADELLRLARILAARGASHNNNTNNSPATITTPTATVSFCNINSNSTETSETREAAAFRRSTLSAYLQGLNGRTCWTTLISAFCTLVENEDDR
ncbi:Ubiquitin carboxyl-terminal hydrolase, partial [Operophtera brumata]